MELNDNAVVAVGDTVGFVGADKATRTAKVTDVHNPSSLVSVEYGPAGFTKAERIVSRKGTHAAGRPYWYPLAKR